MTELRDVLVIGIALVAALAVSACLETETKRCQCVTSL